MGGETSLPLLIKKARKFMFTVSDIINDLNGGIFANNMIEAYFTYRLVYFVNQNGKGTKFCVDTSYNGLRMVLENIIRENLTTTNTVVIAAATTLKDGKDVSLLSRSYGFSLDGYFQQIAGRKGKEYMNNNYGKRKVQWG